ncbi:MAG: hypothetical protein ACC660_06480 [Acidimicrobiales bacterium]
MRRRREVRVADVFFDELDLQLGAERGPDGKPSATDFLVIDLPAIVERFSLGFDELSEVVAGLAAARMFIGTSALVRSYVVHGLEISEGLVELVGIEIDR